MSATITGEPSLVEHFLINYPFVRSSLGSVVVFRRWLDKLQLGLVQLLLITQQLHLSV
jgi:hypothetical protein